MIIRDVRPEEFTAFWTMAEGFKAEAKNDGELPPDPVALMLLVATAQRTNTHHVLVAEKDGKLVGVATGFVGQISLWNETPQGVIHCVYVNPDVRGGVAAKRLVKELERRFQASGVKQINFSYASGIDTERGVRFFEKLGYEIAGIEMTKRVQ